jgi:hypothetical protein
MGFVVLAFSSGSALVACAAIVVFLVHGQPTASQSLLDITADGHWLKYLAEGASQVLGFAWNLLRSLVN